MAAASMCPPLAANRVPTILQNESSECALASLAMIAAAWGLKMDMAAFRARVAVTPRGINLRTLMNLATGIGLAPRPVRIGLQRLGDLKSPAILHWNMDHFVVLERVRGDVATIVDPGRGRLTMTLDSMSPHFTGIAVEFTPTENFQPGKISLSRSFRRAWFDDRRLRSSALSMLWLSLLLQFTLIEIGRAHV